MIINDKKGNATDNNTGSANDSELNKDKQASKRSKGKENSDQEIYPEVIKPTEKPIDDESGNKNKSSR